MQQLLLLFIKCKETRVVITHCILLYINSRLRLLDKHIVFFFTGRQTNTAVGRRRHNVLRPSAGYHGEWECRYLHNNNNINNNNNNMVILRVAMYPTNNKLCVDDVHHSTSVTCRRLQWSLAECRSNYKSTNLVSYLFHSI